MTTTAPVVSTTWREVAIATALSIIATLIVFNDVLTGHIVSNCLHLFHFEPWSHYRDEMITTGNDNHILSDSIDGADANLNPWNVKPLSIGRYLQFSAATGMLLKAIWGPMVGFSYECLVLFVLLNLFTYLYLRQIGIVWPIAMAVTGGFAFGSTNMHLHLGWAYETMCAVVCLFFLERLIQRNRWSDGLLLALAAINLAGRSMVHIVFFYCCVITLYGFMRLAVVRDKRLSLFIKMVTAAAASIILSLDYLWPTIQYYSNNFDKGYRDGFWLRQNGWITYFTFVFANFFGHPKTESLRWTASTYVDSGMFIGSLTFLAAATAGIWRVIVRRDALTIFYAVMAVVGSCYAFQFSFEQVEAYLGAMPLLNWVPSMYFKAVLHLIVAVFGALGLQMIWDDAASGRRLPAAICAVGMVAIVAFAFYVYQYTLVANGAPTPYLMTYMPMAVGLVLLGIVGFLLLGSFPQIVSSTRGRIGAGVALAIFTMSETLLHTAGWIPFARPEYCYFKTETTSFLQERVGIGRIIGMGYAAVPSMISPFSYGVEMAAGRMSVVYPYKLLLQQADPNAYLNHPTQYLFSVYTNLQSPVWDLADVRYFVAPRRIVYDALLPLYPPKTIAVHVLRDGVIFERLRPPKHAYLMRRAKVFKTPEEMAEAVKGGLNVRRVMALESEEQLITPVKGHRSDETARPRVIDVRRGTNTIEVDYSTDRESYLLLSELYNPSWRASIDGEGIPTYRGYFFLQGARVPKGIHTVTFRFTIPYLRIMNVIVGIGAALLFFALFWAFRSERRAAARSSR